MKDDFDKLDKEMMERLKPVREKSIPESIRKNFAEDVEKKIIDGEPASGGFGWGVVLAPALLVFVGVVVFLKMTAVPEKASQVVPPAQPIAKVAKPIAAPTPVDVPAPVAQTPVKSSVVDEVEQLSVETESELFSEIEVLKELGVWNEEDDQILDISMEDSLREMELFAEDFASFEAPPIGSVQGA